MNLTEQTDTSYLEDLVLVRLKRVQLQLQVPQVPKSHGLKIKAVSFHRFNSYKMRTDHRTATRYAAALRTERVEPTLSAEPEARMNSL